MNVSIKTPFAEMSIEMGQEQAMDLIRRAVGYSMAPAEKQGTTEPAVINNTAPAAGAPETGAAPKEKPMPKSRVETMFGPRETWGVPAPENQDAEGHGSGEAYKGFLLIKCEKCGKIKGFCAKYPLTFHQCECGHRTELHDLNPVHAVCKCGSSFKYRTNIRDKQFTINCLDCKAPIDMELNGRGTAYVTIGLNRGGGY